MRPETRSSDILETDRTTLWLFDPYHSSLFSLTGIKESSVVVLAYTRYYVVYKFGGAARLVCLDSVFNKPMPLCLCGETCVPNARFFILCKWLISASRANSTCQPPVKKIRRESFRQLSTRIC